MSVLSPADQTNRQAVQPPAPTPRAPISVPSTKNPSFAPNVVPVQDSQQPSTNLFPRPARDVVEAQIALARLGLSSGSVDGRPGPQTTLAVLAFQRSHHLTETGRLDPSTRETLLLTRAPFTNYVVTQADLDRLQPLSDTWAGKAQQTALDYETILELVAEKSRAHPEFLRRLNPPEVFLAPPAGTPIIVPDTDLGELNPCAFIRVALSSRTLEAFDSQSNLMAHFPCSIAQRVEKRPGGELHVASIAPNPNYTFDPALFPESPEAGQLAHKLVLPPGPNNPVGIAWIGLDKPGYGIHGTPRPEQVGRTESHGCFRLANWNAEHLLKIVRIGTPVYVE
jgi:lipoprotein-anchoring transpeptidase ErfK/SrfK